MPGSPTNLLALLKNRSLRRFFVAQFQSELGTGAAYVALVLVAYHRLHSGWAIALVLLADFLPGIALGAVFGALADRVARKHLLVFADLLRAGAFLGLAITPSFLGTIALALLAGVGTAMFRPTLNAAMTGLVSDEQRSWASALYGASVSIGLTVGPALTALVALFGSPAVMLAVNGATFIFSAALLTTVRFGAGARPAADSRDDRERGSLWTATVDGARAAAAISGVPMILLIGATAILAAGLMNVAEPMLATGPLHAGGSGYSLLVMVYGAAMAAGSLFSARAGSRLTALRRCYLIGLTVQGVGMIGSAAAPGLAWAIGSFALTGAANGLLAGPEVRMLQELVGERLLGRAFGLRNTLANLAFVLAFVSAGAVLAAVGVRAVFALGGAALLALGLAGWVGFRPSRFTETAPVAAEPA
ncbi:MAG TPA: MFS transporter [Solirubrobacteraceae bacterium]|nr:MFS transporter [Solirubrobacteraceae bacterium]